MDKRPALEAPTVAADYGKPLQKQARELGTKVAEINDLWDALDRKKAAFRAADPATFDPATGQGIVAEELKILQRDLAVRKELFGLEMQILAESLTLARAATEKLKVVRADVVERLRSIGYNETPPIAIDKHPDVYAAGVKHDELQRRHTSKDTLNFLKSSMEEIQAGLEQAKHRILKSAV